MDERRKGRLRALLNGKPYKGNRAVFLERAKRTESWLSQALDPRYAFGERAARNLAMELGMRPDYFESDVTPTLSPWGAELGALLDAFPEDERKTVYFLCSAEMDRYRLKAARVRSARPRRVPVQTR